MSDELAVGTGVDEGVTPDVGGELTLSSIIPKAISDALKEAFPLEAIETVTKDDGFVQTGVRPAWIIERLNTVMGIEGWDAEELEIREMGNDVATKVRLNLYIVVGDGGNLTKVSVATRTQWGSARKRGKAELGDILKSAYTNALCKCASMYDVAHQAYKGQLPVVKPKAEDVTVDVEEAKNYDLEKAVSAEVTVEPIEDIKEARKKLRDVAAANRITRNQVQKISESKFGKAASKDLTAAELSTLIAILGTLKDEPDNKDGEDNKEEN